FSIGSLLILTAGCAGRNQRPETNPDDPAMVQVENRGFADMVIYAVSGSQRVRLGLATGNSTKSFSIPATLIRGGSPLKFLADPIGGSRSPITEEMVVQPGEIVSLTIPP
ncbi:MAG TPA: hypothetical protein VJU17_06245, partial [Gemmatimonadales bacterium]|nr:hypothetical protein [Gemmatimonadales bacterium]